MKCNDCFFTFINITVVLLGASMVISAYNFQQTMHEYNDVIIEDITAQFKYNPELIWAAIILGSSCFILGLMGCLLSLTSSRLLYILYFSGTSVWTAAYITYLGSIVYYALIDERNFQATLQSQLESYPHDEKIRDVIDNVQKNMHCCGNEDYRDWLAIIGYIPDSCCRSKTLDAQLAVGNNCTEQEAMRRDGCIIPLERERKRNTFITVAYIVSTMLFQVITVAIPYQLKPYEELSSPTSPSNVSPI